MRIKNKTFKNKSFIRNLIVNLTNKIEKENIEIEKENNKQSESEKMFNDIGYKFDYEGSHNTIYAKYVHWLGDVIYFDYLRHRVIIENGNGKVRDCNMRELNAINSKCHELGWL